LFLIKNITYNTKALKYWEEQAKAPPWSKVTQTMRKIYR